MFASLVALLLVAHRLDAVPVGGSHGPLPWHLADVYLDLPKPVPLTTLSVDLHVLDDPPGGHRLFLAPVAGFAGSEPFYVGQLTQVVNARRMDDAIHRPHLPDGFLFARRGDSDKTAVRQSSGGFYHVGDHEGPHVGVKVLHRWRKGRYTYRLAVTEREYTARHGWVNWVAAFVLDHHTQSELYIGSLRFPGHSVELTGTLGWFAEVYGVYGDEPSPGVVPLIRVVVGGWKLNGVALKAGGLSASYLQGVPQVAEVKPVKRFIADGDCPPLKDLPTGDDAAGLIIRPKPIQRTPGLHVLWTAPRP